MKTFLENDNLSIHSDFSEFGNILHEVELKEDFKTEIHTVRNSKISKKTFTKLNIFDVKERMTNILENKKKIQEMEVQYKNSNNKILDNQNLTFSNLCLNLDEQCENNNRSAFSKYFITLLHLSNEKNLSLKKTNDGDININF